MNCSFSQNKMANLTIAENSENRKKLKTAELRNLLKGNKNAYYTKMREMRDLTKISENAKICGIHKKNPENEKTE